MPPSFFRSLATSKLRRETGSNPGQSARRSKGSEPQGGYSLAAARDRQGIREASFPCEQEIRAADHFPKTNELASKSPDFVGVDIGKLWLDVAGFDAAFRVPNTASGFSKLRRLILRRDRLPHFICEPGSYGRALVKFLHAKKLPCSIVSAYQVRQFAKAGGQAAKTDKIDARVLAMFGQTFQPEATRKPDLAAEKLRRLVRRRQQVVEAMKVQKHQLETMEGAALIRDAKGMVKRLSAYARQLEKTSVAHVKKTPALARQFKVLTGVDGVGSVSALQLISEVPELGAVSRREIAALVGLAPINYDSGIKTGRRSIRGGRILARTALYMAAFHASRVNPVLKPFYQRLRERGKPYRVALVAVMRKLAIYLNAIVAHEHLRSSPVSLATSRRQSGLVESTPPERGASSLKSDNAGEN